MALNSYFYFAAVVITLLGFVSRGEGIKCYKCSSEQDYNCRDPFNYRHIPTVDCSRDQGSYLQSYGICRKIVRRVYGQLHVERGCSPESTYDRGRSCDFSATNDGTIEHCSVCTTDECNAASTLTAWSSLAAMSVFWLAAKFLF